MHFTRSSAPVLFAIVAFIGVETAGADAPVLSNWPQWRGPLATGVAPHANPPVSWSDTTNIKWKVKIPGDGSSTPIIWEDKVFIQTAIPTGKKVKEQAEPQQEPSPDAGQDGKRFRRANTPDEYYQFVLLCLDRKTGKTLWQEIACEVVPHEGHHHDHGFASFSPATDGTCVIAYFGSRGLYCYDLEGNLKWKKDLGRQQTRNSFGEGSSPVLFGNVVITNWDHEGTDDFIVAFDKQTGQELWRQAREEPTTWATPLVIEHEGRQQVVTAGTERIRAYDLMSGEMLWHCDGLTTNAIPTPVGADGVVYLTSGFRGAELMAIRLGHTGDLTDSEAIVWSHNKHTPYVPSPLLYGNRLYFFASNNSILSCFDAKLGQPLFGPQRLQHLENVYASPVGAADRVYLVGRNGVTLVIKLADQFEVLATNTLGEPIDASPALVGNEIFLRGKQHLFCIAEPE